MKPIMVFGNNWKIPPVEGSTVPEGQVCMETSWLTTATAYISCNNPATMRVYDPRAGRCYDMCHSCGTHNLTRGMTRT